MKCLSLLVLTMAVAFPAAAQNHAGEERTISHSVDRWITMNSEAPYSLYFLYLDEESGEGTLYPGGSFRISDDGKCVRIASNRPADEKPSILRIMQNSPVIVLSEQCREELGLEEVPERLKYRDTSSAGYRVKLGGWLNYLRDYEAALVPLEAAWKESPATEDAADELAFTCTMLKRYEQAIAVAEDGVRRNPKDYRAGNELGDALLDAGRFDDAIARYLATIPICPDNRSKSGMATGLAIAYSERGDEASAAKWRANAKAWEPVVNRR